jgi:hypothetical protein
MKRSIQAYRDIFFDLNAAHDQSCELNGCILRYVYREMFEL